jgi:hypothetical protein
MSRTDAERIARFYLCIPAFFWLLAVFDVRLPWRCHERRGSRGV